MAQAAADREAVDAGKALSSKIVRQMRQPTALSATVELIGLRQPGSSPFHRWWTTQVAITPEETAKLLDAVEKQGLSAFYSPDGSLSPDSALDAVEVHLLATRIGRRGGTYYPRDLDSQKFIKELDSRPDVAFRAAALQFAPRSSPRPQDVEWRGQRVIAEIALEEAELLALRLPELTSELYHTALSSFTRAHDRFGAMRTAVSAAFASKSAQTEPLSNT